MAYGTVMKDFPTGMYEYLLAIKKLPPSICSGHIEGTIYSYKQDDRLWDEAHKRGLTVYVLCPHDPSRQHPLITSKGELALEIIKILRTNVMISLG